MNATSSKKDKVGLFSEKTALARKFFVGASAIALFALSGQEAQATTTIWMDGVSESSGWVDYNKSWDNDNLLCWAASSSNIIEWWQNKASAAGISIPAGTPTSDIFSVFKSTFGDQAIGTDVGWEWYFTGYSGSTTSYSGGEYWKNYVDSLNLPANGSLPGYIDHGWAYNIYSTDTYYDTLVSTLTTKFEEGAGLSLVIVSSTDTGHAVTLWGMEVDDGKLSKVYITDSDDSKSGLIAYDVNFQTETATEGDGKDTSITTWERTKIYLTNYYGGSYYISSWSSLSIAVPEPSAFGLLAGVGALALAVSRRRRSRK